MRLKRGHEYGSRLGSNGSDKINGYVEGYSDPSSIRTVFVEADVLLSVDELPHLSCVTTSLVFLALLATVYWRSWLLSILLRTARKHPVSSLSGSWLACKSPVGTWM